MAECVRCGRRKSPTLTCNCARVDLAQEGRADGPPWADVPFAIDVAARLIWEDPKLDHVFIEPVAACGHVGKGHVREIPRDCDIPVDEWFGLGRWMGPETAGILFIGRTRDHDRVGEDDLDVARVLASYAASHPVPAWELVFVTSRGNFKASELLGLPGLPRFEPCTYE
jgi:hypothetical protein